MNWQFDQGSVGTACLSLSLHSAGASGSWDWCLLMVCLLAGLAMNAGCLWGPGWGCWPEHLHFWWPGLPPCHVVARLQGQTPWEQEPGRSYVTFSNPAREAPRPHLDSILVIRSESPCVSTSYICRYKAPHRLGGFSNRDFCLTVLEVPSPRSRCHQGWLLLGPLFLACG